MKRKEVIYYIFPYPLFLTSFWHSLLKMWKFWTCEGTPHTCTVVLRGLSESPSCTTVSWLNTDPTGRVPSSLSLILSPVSSGHSAPSHNWACISLILPLQTFLYSNLNFAYHSQHWLLQRPAQILPTNYIIPHVRRANSEFLLLLSLCSDD
jgi:hypothetical protein